MLFLWDLFEIIFWFEGAVKSRHIEQPNQQCLVLHFCRYLSFKASFLSLAVSIKICGYHKNSPIAKVERSVDVFHLLLLCVIV